MTELKKTIQERFGEDVNKCFQCLKCSNGCPQSEEMQLKPHQVIKTIQSVKGDEPLDCNSAWVCVSCYTCSVRCPNDIDIAKVMDAIRILSAEHKRESSKNNALIFHRNFLDSVKATGRVFETAMMAFYNLKSLNLFANAGLAVKMLLKGRLALVPHFVKKPKNFGKIFDSGDSKDE